MIQLLKTYRLFWFSVLSLAWTCFALPLHAQQLDSLHGVVIDDEGVVISGVSLVINGKPAIYTDKNGIFAAGPLGGDGKVHMVIAKKEGYRMASWGIPNKKDGIEVLMRRQGGIRGDVIDNSGHHVPRISIKLDAPIAYGPVYTDEDGHFTMDIPASTAIDKSAKFTVDGKALEGSALNFSEGNKKVVIRYTPASRIPSSTYTLLLLDETGRAISFAAVSIENKMYVADQNGLLKFPWKGNIDYLPISVEDYILQGGKPLEEGTRKPFIFKKKSLEHSAHEGVIPTTPPITSTEGLENVILDKYGEDFNSIFAELRLERRQLTYKSDSIRKEVKRVVNQLSDESKLDDHERHTLTQYLIRLEEELIASNEALRSVQQRTEETFIHMRDALVHKDSINLKASQTITQIEAEKEQIANELQRDILIFGVVILSLLLISFAFFFFARSTRRKNKEVAATNAQLKRTQSHLHVTLAEVNALNESVTRQHQKITNSIRYAQTIQQAILPTISMMDEFFKEYFIIFKPKEIVSGDFYWAAKTKDGSKTFVAAIDCTGHGVPGGFMSMIGHSLLNDLVHHKMVHDPAIILEHLNQGIRIALKQDDKVNEDGMDVALCLLEKLPNGNTQVTFSGAMRPLYYYTEGKMNQIKGAVKSAGGLQRRADRDFENQILELTPGSMLYLCSDGISDQHNRSNHKLGTRRLVEILEEGAALAMEAQQKNIEEEFEHFKDGTEQRDDVMLLGIRIV